MCDSFIFQTDQTGTEIQCNHRRHQKIYAIGHFTPNVMVTGFNGLKSRSPSQCWV